MKSTIFICQLPKADQQNIEKALLTVEEKLIVDNAMCGRLVDIEEVVDVPHYLATREVRLCAR